jgi:hypothetical protein
MKQLVAGLLAVGTALASGTGAGAQTLYGNVYQPPVSPYVWLGARGGAAAGFNYYSIVQPQLQLNAAFGGTPFLAGTGGYGSFPGLGLGSGWGGAYGGFGGWPGLGGAYGISGPWGGIWGPGGPLTTGHPAQFGNYAHFYPALGYRGGFAYGGGYGGGMQTPFAGGMQQGLPSGYQGSMPSGTSGSGTSSTPRSR